MYVNNANSFHIIDTITCAPADIFVGGGVLAQKRPPKRPLNGEKICKKTPHIAKNFPHFPGGGGPILSHPLRAPMYNKNSPLLHIFLIKHGQYFVKKSEFDKSILLN